MRVGYELTDLQLDTGGTARAVRSLAAALCAHGDVELVELAHPPGSGGRLRRGLSRELTWFPLLLGPAARRRRVALLHCPAALAPWRAPRGVPLVLTVHDLLAFDHPRWLTPSNVAQQRLVLGLALRAAALVLTPSAFTRDRLRARFPFLDADRVRVIPWGVDARFVAQEGADPRPRSRPYVLAVGTWQPRKGLDVALDAFAALSRTGTHERELLIAGARGWGDAALARRAAAQPGVRVLGRVSDADLAALYRGADCLLFCSRGEGFGFPLLEAMASGTPVICSDRASLPELAGGAALLVDPADPAGIAATLGALLADPPRRAELADRGRRRATDFTWERCARETVAAYADALAASHARRARSAR